MKPLALLLLLPLAALADATEGYAPKIVAMPILRTGTTAAGQPITYPKVADPEVTAVLVEIPPGAETGWHTHPFPIYGYVLAGELDVEIEGGKKNRYKAGDAIAEAVGLLHNGRNSGTEPVRLILFVTGEKGRPFTVKAAKP